MAGSADDTTPEKCISPVSSAVRPTVAGAWRICTSRFCSRKYPRSIAMYQGKYDVEREGWCRFSFVTSGAGELAAGAATVATAVGPEGGGAAGGAQAPARVHATPSAIRPAAEAPRTTDRIMPASLSQG